MILIITGCGCNKKYTTNTCELVSDQSGSGYISYKTYKIYSTKDLVNKVEITEEIKSNKKDILDFFEKQFSDFDYKIGIGESINDVIKREEEALLNILYNNRDQKILVVGHSTAITALLSKWCQVNYTGPYTFKNNVFFDGKWDYCETFKLEFDDNNQLINIQNIVFK